METTSRAARLLRRVLKLTKPSCAETKRIDIHEILEDVAELVLCGYKDRVGINFEFKAEHSGIDADPAEFQSAVLNLLVNARDAIEGKGEITIRTGNESPDAADPKDTGLKGELIVIEVVDTGCGIPPEQVAEIFKPFTTSKANGTGLGLPMVRRFVQESKGKIRVKSKLHEGTTFELRFSVPSMLPK